MSTFLKLRFSGGMELLFDNKRAIDGPIPLAPATPMRQLLAWMKDHLIRERAELFLDGDTVRPGVLVLINEADWELEGELEYPIKDNDEIVFISTLHGG